jgi:hypothetical protein
LLVAHERVLLYPLRLHDETLRVQVGSGAVTIRVWKATTEPPGPEQVTVYVFVEEGDTDMEPEVRPPVEKLVPTHDVALTDAHVSVEELPGAIDAGDATNDTAGTGAVAVTEFEQFTLTDCDPDVTVTVPVLVPTVEYDFATFTDVPESESVPLQE